MTTQESTKLTESTAPVPPTAVKLPAWLNAELFAGILKQNVPNYKQIKNFKAQPAVAAGENYQTMVVRIELEAELKDDVVKAYSFIMKLPQESAMFKLLMQLHNVFRVEMNTYNEIIPDFERMYREAGITVNFGAKCYNVNTPSEYGVVLLEDLCTRGFKNANRLEGLDMEHIQCVLKKLAQWHAASAVRFETKGKYDDIYVIGIWNEQQLVHLNTISVKILLECMQHYEGHETYYEKVEKLQRKLGDELICMVKTDANEFNVLNHGDLCSNNIMFQYDAFGKIKETLLVDFQMPKYGTPAQDLFYFLLSSTKLELKLQHFDYFVKYYHDNLVENLKLLKYSKKLPLLKDLHIALIKYGAFGFYTATTTMSGALLDPNELASVENFFSDTTAGNNFKMLLYSNPRYCKHMEIIMPWLNNRGALD